VHNRFSWLSAFSGFFFQPESSGRVAVVVVAEVVVVGVLDCITRSVGLREGVACFCREILTFCNAAVAVAAAASPADVAAAPALQRVAVAAASLLPLLLLQSGCEPIAIFILLQFLCDFLAGLFKLFATAR